MKLLRFESCREASEVLEEDFVEMRSRMCFDAGGVQGIQGIGLVGGPSTFF